MVVRLPARRCPCMRPHASSVRQRCRMSTSPLRVFFGNQREKETHFETRAGGRRSLDAAHEREAGKRPSTIDLTHDAEYGASLLLVTLPPPNFAPPLIAFQQH